MWEGEVPTVIGGNEAIVKETRGGRLKEHRRVLPLVPDIWARHNGKAARFLFVFSAF